MRGLKIATFVHFGIFKFDGKIVKFQKIRIFERNSATYYFSVRKCPMSRLVLNGKISKFQKIQIFEHNSALDVFCEIFKII